jgi:hypothetical protein
VLESTGVTDAGTIFQLEAGKRSKRSSRKMPGRKMNAEYGALHFSAPHFSALTVCPSLKFFSSKNVL